MEFGATGNAHVTSSVPMGSGHASPRAVGVHSFGPTEKRIVIVVVTLSRAIGVTGTAVISCSFGPSTVSRMMTSVSGHSGVVAYYGPSSALHESEALG